MEALTSNRKYGMKRGTENEISCSSPGLPFGARGFPVSFCSGERDCDCVPVPRCHHRGGNGASAVRIATIPSIAIGRIRRLRQRNALRAGCRRQTGRDNAAECWNVTAAGLKAVPASTAIQHIRPLFRRRCSDASVLALMIVRKFTIWWRDHGLP